MALSTATEQVLDSRAAVAASTFLSGWHNKTLSADDIFYFKVIADRAWTKLTYWHFSANAPADFSYDVTIDYIPTLADGDDWDVAPTASSTGTQTITPTGSHDTITKTYDLTGLVPGTLCYIQITLDNWTLSRNVRMGNLHLHTAADA